MRSITLKFMLLAMLVTCARYSGASPAPDEQTGADMNAMSVAELEKAGDQARAQKDYVLATRYFQTALRKDRQNAVIYNKLGMVELRTDDWESARLNFERAAKLNPKFADAVNNVGAVAYRNKRYGAAAKYFKKAVALEESRATFHVNLGSAWFSQKKLDRAMVEYTRALELDPDAFSANSRAGVVAQMNPDERAQYSYTLAKLYAKRGDLDNCLQCLKKAKEDGYRNMANVYKDEEFSRMRDNPRLQEVVPPPVAK